MRGRLGALPLAEGTSRVVYMPPEARPSPEHRGPSARAWRTTLDDRDYRAVRRLGDANASSHRVASPSECPVRSWRVQECGTRRGRAGRSGDYQGFGDTALDNDIFVVHTDGTNEKRPTKPPSRVDFGPAWSPAGATSRLRNLLKR